MSVYDEDKEALDVFIDLIKNPRIKEVVIGVETEKGTIMTFVGPKCKKILKELQEKYDEGF